MYRACIGQVALFADFSAIIAGFRRVQNGQSNDAHRCIAKEATEASVSHLSFENSEFSAGHLSGASERVFQPAEVRSGQDRKDYGDF